ncbi:MAG: hypothetical protein RBJ76_03265 [Stenomitos frigidus ULC029]
MTYQNTEIETEGLADRCWIQLQCHAREAIRGWAFRVGGGFVSQPDWEYGYPSKEEAKNRAIDFIEEHLKTKIRRIERDLTAAQNLLTVVHQHQRQRSEIYS